MKHIVWLFIWLLVFFSHPSSIFAEENFSTTYDITYAIMESGVTRVQFTISLTNKTSEYYVSSYKVRVGFSDIENLQASDPEGPLSPTIEGESDESTIAVVFKKRVVGLGNTLTLALSFDTKDIVQKQGNIWEVNIPGIENQSDFERFSVHVKTPPALGSPTYIKPAQPTNDLNFSKEQLGRGGISISFGSQQFYAFTLFYHLKNTHVFPIKTEIALPPTTNYQDVYIDDIIPKPINVRNDENGNWLALFALAPSQSVDITVKGKAKLSLHPKKQVESEENLSLYLREQPYWQVRNPEIQQLAKTLKTPYAIYEYIVKTLTYDYSRVTENKPRLGALQALKNPSSAVCLEFTDLFVTLARAAGIPAREVDGFAYTQNPTQRPLSLVKDILHAWPEYYDLELQTWIMIDPTWGNTTRGTDYFSVLDFDHFAFVIKGSKSNYPVPAGGYKLQENANAKDVHVAFGELFTTVPSLVTSLALPQTVVAGFPIEGYVLLKNTGGALFPSQYMHFESSTIQPTNTTISISDIPPFGYEKIPISLQKTNILTNTNAHVTIRIADIVINQNLHIKPFYLIPWIIIIGGVFAASIAFVIFIITRSSGYLSLFRQKEENSLRRESKKS